VGDGPELPAMRRVAEELGVADRIRFLGHVTDERKRRALAVSDAFVSTSQHEGFGLVFLEAMASGLPVVCYDRGGQTDFLTTPATGCVARLNDLDGIIRGVLDLAHDAPRRTAIRSHNLALAEQYFADRCALRYEAIFEQALRERSTQLAVPQRDSRV